jgi:hypothetical protein
MLVIADGKTLTQARAAARTLAAVRDVAEDNQRLKRFNVEQREILTKRLDAVQERLRMQRGGSGRMLQIDINDGIMFVAPGWRILEVLDSEGFREERQQAEDDFIAGQDPEGERGQQG